MLSQFNHQLNEQDYAFEKLLALNEKFLLDRNPSSFLVFLSQQTFESLSQLLHIIQKYTISELKRLNDSSYQLKPTFMASATDPISKIKILYNFICQVSLESKFRRLTDLEIQTVNTGFAVFNLYLQVKDMIIMEYTIHLYTQKLGMPLEQFKENLRTKPNFPLAPEIIENYRFFKHRVEMSIVQQVFTTPAKIV
jgi:hypothetical protein